MTTFHLMEKTIVQLHRTFDEQKVPTNMARFELLPVVQLEEVAEVERELGWRLPEDHAWFLMNLGRLVAYSDNGREHFRMLTPRESLARLQHEKECFDETVFGDGPEEIASAHRELAVRLALYPFQYMGHYVSDFYCFWTRCSAPVIDVYHDDFELAPWLGQFEPNFEEGAFPGSFTEHLSWMATLIVAGTYGPSADVG